jgi:hypothetical protein
MDQRLIFFLTHLQQSSKFEYESSQLYIHPNLLKSQIKNQKGLLEVPLRVDLLSLFAVVSFLFGD